MAREIIELQAVARTGTGKGAARQARRDGFVPGIVYGNGEEPVAINMNYNYLLKRLRQGRFLQTLFNLKVEGQADVNVVCRAVQRDVVKDLPTHIDFVRVNDASRIELYVPVKFVNEDKAPGIKRGGSLAVAAAELKLEVTAGAIPEAIEIDLEGKNIGDEISITDVVFPNGEKALFEKEYTVASIAAPSGLAAAAEE